MDIYNHNYDDYDYEYVLEEIKLRRENYQTQTGKLNINLVWNGLSDLDLNVICPCKTSISFYQSGCYKCKGKLDVDMNRNPKTASSTPIENIYWNEPISGIYQIFVSNYQNRLNDDQPVQYYCLIEYMGKTRLLTGIVKNREKQLVYQGDLLNT